MRVESVCANLVLTSSLQINYLLLALDPHVLHPLFGMFTALISTALLDSFQP